MTASITRLDGQDAYDLLYAEYLAKLSPIEQETMQRTIMNSSKLWAGKVDDKLLAIWGLVAPTLMSDRAYLWLFTTEHLPSHKMTFLRHSRAMVRSMLEDYSTIVGHCLTSASRSQQWLRWLGAEFDEPNDKAVSFTIKAQP